MLYGDEFFKGEVSLLILNATIHLVLSTNRFDEPHYLPKFTGAFPCIHNYVATILEFLKFSFLVLVIKFFIPGIHNSHGAR